MQNMNIVVDLRGKMFKSCVDEKIFYPRCELKLTLTLTTNLTLGLGLGLTPGKTISAEKLKPNAKHEYRRRPQGKNV